MGETDAESKRLSPGSPVSRTPGVSEKRAQALSRLGIRRAADLLRHFPHRYELESEETLIGSLPVGSNGAARGRIEAVRVVRGGRGGARSARGGKGRVEAVLTDDRDRVHLVWFNSTYMAGKLHPDDEVRAQGKVAEYNGYVQMVNPKVEWLESDGDVSRREARLKPIYPASAELPSGVLERVIAEALPLLLPHVEDPLPETIRQRLAMPALTEAFRAMHQPADEEEAGAARRRLAFNEWFLLQLGMAAKRHHLKSQVTAPTLRFNGAIDQHIRARFPFDLTAAQDKAVHEIVADLQKPRPMNRLLQGDVGSGKTVVALYAMLLAVASEHQAALVTPTELLAEQHHAAISQMLDGSNVKLGLLTGGSSSTRSSERAAIEQAMASGELDIVIGTQAVIGRREQFKRLGVVVIDEQHRFGVTQRAAIRRDLSGRAPHFLVMTATPIPRTLSLTIFGDLDVSTIDRAPSGRGRIVTKVVDRSTRERVYGYVGGRLARGEQAYVVAPTVDETSGEPKAGGEKLQNTRELARELSRRWPKLRVEAVHGRQKPERREALMRAFRAGEIHALVATTVIEVGVDVPNATMIVIEHAERFGLAQLHQLRGRVGRTRDGRESLCVLIGDPPTEQASQRLEAVRETTDGFRIAEADLRIRGMGDFFGTRQHGLPPLRVARLPDDLELLLLARREAESLIASDPPLRRPEHAALRKLLLQEFGEGLNLGDVG